MSRDLTRKQFLAAVARYGIEHCGGTYTITVGSISRSYRPIDFQARRRALLAFLLKEKTKIGQSPVRRERFPNETTRRHSAPLGMHETEQRLLELEQEVFGE
jgi:hypothetical protein